MADDARQAQADAQAQADQRQDQLRAAADMDAKRLDSYKTFRDYYDGEHQVHLSDRQRQYLERSGITWSENFCGTLIDTHTGRLRIDGWAVDADSDEGTAEESVEQDLAQQANDWWRLMRGNLVRRVCHEEASVCGDGFVIVDWDQAQGIPRFTYNRPEMCKPVYSDDQPDRLEYVAKVWNSSLGGEKIRRLNLYYPDRIEKWFSWSTAGENEHWHAFVDAEDYTTETGENGPVEVPIWPIPWLDAKGQPLGIPVVHFRNNPGSGTYGRSELKSAIPQNDALNKHIQDLFDVVDYLAAPVPYATGVEGDFDASFVPGEWKVSAGENVKIGMLPGADPKGLLEVIQSDLRRIAARNRVPLHDLIASGDFPSGEALKAANAGATAKAEDRREPLGDKWSECWRIAVRLANTFGSLSLPEDATVEPQWCDAEIRNELVEAQTAEIWHELGASKRTLLERAGFDPDQEEAQRAKEADAEMERQQQMFDAGVGPGARLPDAAPTKPPQGRNGSTVGQGAAS